MGCAGKTHYAIITPMKKLLTVVLLILFVLTTISIALTKFEYYPQKIRIKSLLKEPTLDSEDAFVFPIEVTLTGVSKDKKWYRFKVFYDLVFLGKYEFEGWCRADPWEPFLKKATPEVIDLE